MKKIWKVYLLFSFLFSISLSVGFYSFTNVSTLEDISEYVKVTDVIKDTNITYIHLLNTYDQSIFFNYIVFDNFSINYSILNVSLYYDNVSFNITSYVYNDSEKTFKIYNITIPIGESIVIIRGPNSTVNTTTNNVFILPENQNYSVLVNKTFNFTFSVNSYSNENYTVNISVFLDNQTFANWTNDKITGFYNDYIIQNIKFNTTGIHVLKINVTTNISEYNYKDNFRTYFINVTQSSENYPPVIEIYSPLNGTEYNTNNVLINFSVYDNDIYSVYWILLYNNSISLISNTSAQSINYTKYLFLPNGNYNLIISAVDYGNNVNTKEIYFKVNKIEETYSNPSPVIKIFSPLNKTYNDPNVIINFTVEDNNFYKSVINIYDDKNNLVFNDTSKLENYIKSVNLSVGNYVLKVLAIDAGGKTDYKEVHFKVYLNVSNSKLSVYLNNGTIVNKPYLNVSYEIFNYHEYSSYLLNVSISCENNTFVESDFPSSNLNEIILNFDNITNGICYLNFTLYENNKFVDLVKKYVVLNITSQINNTPPVIFVYSPNNEQVYLNNSILLYVNISDENLYFYKISLIDQNNVSFYYKTGNDSEIILNNISLVPGNYTLYVFAKDIFGLNSSKEIKFSIVNFSQIPKPQVLIYYPKKGDYVKNNKVNINFEVISDYIKSVVVYVKDPNGNLYKAYEYDIQGNYSLPLELDGYGTYYVFVYAKDYFDRETYNYTYFNYIYNNSVYNYSTYLSNIYNVNNTQINISIISPKNTVYINNIIPIKFTVSSTNNLLIEYSLIGDDNKTYLYGSTINKSFNYSKILELPYNKSYLFIVSAYIIGSKDKATRVVNFNVTYLDYLVKDIYIKNSNFFVVLCSNKLNKTINYLVYANDVLVNKYNTTFTTEKCKTIKMDSNYIGKYNIKVIIENKDSNMSNNILDKTLVFKPVLTSYGESKQTPENPWYVFIILIILVMFLITRKKSSGKNTIN